MIYGDVSIISFPLSPAPFDDGKNKVTGGPPPPPSIKPPPPDLGLGCTQASKQAECGWVGHAQKDFFALTVVVVVGFSPRRENGSGVRCPRLCPPFSREVGRSRSPLSLTFWGPRVIRNRPPWDGNGEKRQNKLMAHKHPHHLSNETLSLKNRANSK